MFSWKKKEGSSSSAAWKSRARELFPLAAGTVLTILAVLAARQRVASLEREILERDRPIEVVVAAAPIPSGGSLGEAELAKKAIPASGATGRNVPAAEFARLLGATVRNEIAAGEPVLWTDVDDPDGPGDFSGTIPAGRRAITIDADARASFSGLLRPGDRVDILSEPAEGTGFRPLLSDVPVVAVDHVFRRSAAGDDPSGTSTLTLSVSPAESESLAAALGRGGIQVLLRNPRDRSRPPRNPARRRPAARTVEIWKGGVPEPPRAARGGDGT